MNYTNEQIRRQDRLLEKEKAISLLKNGEYGVLSMQDEENGAYGVPINYVWNKKNSIYIHCAPEGRKLHCIKHCNTVSFCIIGKTHIISNQFTTEYESIILKCRAYIGLNEEERINALHLLIEKRKYGIGIQGIKKRLHSLFQDHGGAINSLYRSRS